MKDLVIGIGNDFGGDDGAGLLAARALEGRLPATARIIEHSGEGTSLVEAWQGYDRVFIIDAVRSGARPGSVTRWTRMAGLPETRVASSHALGLAEALRLADALGSLPASLVVYGIEGSRFGTGQRVSKAVARGAARAAGLLLDEIEDLKGGTPDA